MRRTKQRTSPGWRRAMLGLFAVAFAFILVVSLQWLPQAVALAMRGEAATATLVAVRAGAGQRTGGGCAARMIGRWTDRQGVVQEAQLNRVSLGGGFAMSLLGCAVADDLAVGDTVAVVYNPAQPEQVSLAPYAGATGVAGAVGGIVLGVGGLLVCLRRLLRRRVSPLAPAV